MTARVCQDRIDGILNSYHKILDKYGVDLIFYSDHEDVANNIIKLDCEFVYSKRDNEIKTLTAFNLIKDRFHHKYDWYFFVDDDTFINIPLLMEKVEEFDEDYPYGKDIRGCWGGLPYASGGAGFLVPDKMVHKMFDLKNFNSAFNDVSIGYNMQERGIVFKDSDYFDTDNPHKRGNHGNTKNELMTHITFHYSHPDMMELFQQYVNEIYNI